MLELQPGHLRDLFLEQLVRAVPARLHVGLGRGCVRVRGGPVLGRQYVLRVPEQHLQRQRGDLVRSMLVGLLFRVGCRGMHDVLSWLALDGGRVPVCSVLAGHLRRRPEGRSVLPFQRTLSARLVPDLRCDLQRDGLLAVPAGAVLAFCGPNSLRGLPPRRRARERLDGVHGSDQIAFGNCVGDVVSAALRYLSRNNFRNR